jgi:four helix bundle protein
MKDFQTLKVWEKSHELTLAIYKISVGFPKEEMYGLTSQIRRSSMSIPTNTAEGCGRDGDAEFARFLQIAMGSVSELEYQLLLSRDLKILKATDFDDLNLRLEYVRRMIIALIKKVKADKSKNMSVLGPR